MCVSMGFFAAQLLPIESCCQWVSWFPMVCPLCFAQGDPSQRSWKYSISSWELGTSHVCSHEGVCIILENESHWIQLLYWWIYWMSLYLGLFSNAYIHTRCAETASLTPTAQLGQTAPFSLCQWFPQCRHSTAPPCQESLPCSPAVTFSLESSSRKLLCFYGGDLKTEPHNT